jgi:hypothetical protein
MKLLLAIKSCCRDTKVHPSIRNTWAQSLPVGVDVRFFVGRGFVKQSEKDEVQVKAGDEYLDLCAKVQRMLEWSLFRGYDYTFLADTDTYIHPDRLLACFSQVLIGCHDYAGTSCGWFAQGGEGYFVSRRFAELIVNAPPQTTNEDQQSGTVAKANSIPLFTPRGFDQATVHLGRGGVQLISGWHEEIHKKFRYDKFVDIPTGTGEFWHCIKTERIVHGIGGGRGGLTKPADANGKVLVWMRTKPGGMAVGEPRLIPEADGVRLVVSGYADEA